VKTTDLDDRDLSNSIDSESTDGELAGMVKEDMIYTGGKKVELVSRCTQDTGPKE
jgi:hypothetical protein